MRIGEALALQWGDIDFNNRQITVQQGVVLNKIEDSTKNHKDRKVDMSMQLASCLKLHKKDLRKKAFAVGITNNLWLFPGKNWIMPLDKNSWRKRVFILTPTVILYLVATKMLLIGSTIRPRLA